MAIFAALSSGRSGLIVNGASLSVIGNNIANVGTVGFKGSRTEFTDLLSASAGGQLGKIGLGARIGAVRTLFEQGAIESTGRALDMAIEGEGFFVLREGLGQVYTRAGNFQKNADGTVTNELGDILQGMPLDQAGQPTGPLSDVNVAGLASQANPTSAISLSGNLDAASPGAGPFDGTSFASAYATSDFSTSVQVFDSLGGAHEMSLFFTKTGANAWQVHMGVDAGETGGTAGNLQLVNGAGGTVTFNTDGSVASAAGLTATMTFSGAAAQNVALDMNDFTQVSGSSGVSGVTQDGYGAGGLVSITVNSKGILTGTFDNGQTRPLFQLGIANFRNPEGLVPSGNQLYRASVDSGPAAVATAQSQGNGSIVGSALEQSNVQIAQEFIDLISTQKAFQANARVITASDQLLGDLINVIR
jgi:flagellar hook protein FlgE